MRNAVIEDAQKKFDCYVSRRYCWIQNDNICEKLDRLCSMKRVTNYYKQFELETEYKQFPLKMYPNTYDLHCNFQSAIANKLQMVYIPNLARNKLYRNHIEKYYENRIYLDFWKLTRRIKSCFKSSSSMGKQVSLMELIRKEKEFKKNRLLKSGLLNKSRDKDPRRKKNWRESDNKRAKKSKRRLDLNINLDFLQEKLEGLPKENITGLLNNLSRLVSKSHIEIEILGDPDEFKGFSFLNVANQQDIHLWGSVKLSPSKDSKVRSIKKSFSDISSRQESIDLSDIQSNRVLLKTDRPMLSSKRKRVLNQKRYTRSSLRKKSNKKLTNLTSGKIKCQNFSQKFSKFRDNLDEAGNLKEGPRKTNGDCYGKTQEIRSMDTSHGSPEMRKDFKRFNLLHDKKRRHLSRGGSKSSRRLQNSQMLQLKSYRTSDRNSRSPNRCLWGSNKIREQRIKQNISIPFTMLDQAKSSSSKEKIFQLSDSKQQIKIVSKIPGTLDSDFKFKIHKENSNMSNKREREFVLQESQEKQDQLKTPQKSKKENKRMEERDTDKRKKSDIPCSGSKVYFIDQKVTVFQKVSSSFHAEKENEQLRELKDKDLEKPEVLSQMILTPLSRNTGTNLFGKREIESVQKLEEKLKNESLSKLSQNFVSQGGNSVQNIQESLKVEKCYRTSRVIVGNLKGSLDEHFLEQTTLEQIKGNSHQGKTKNFQSKKDSEKDQFTVSYNYSTSMGNSKKFEISQKLRSLGRIMNCLPLSARVESKSAVPELVDLVFQAVTQKNIAGLDILDDLEILLISANYSKQISQKKTIIKLFNRTLFSLKLKRGQRNYLRPKLKRYLKMIKNRSRNKLSTISEELLKCRKELLPVKKEIKPQNLYSNKKKFIRLNSSRKKDESVTTNEILIDQSTRLTNMTSKESYLLNNHFKTGQKKRNHHYKKTRNLLTQYTREKVFNSVLNSSEISRTNLSNKIGRASGKNLYNETFASISQTKRRKQKEDWKRRKRPPIKTISSAMKLSRDAIFGSRKKHLEKNLNNKFKAKTDLRNHQSNQGYDANFQIYESSGLGLVSGSNSQSKRDKNISRKITDKKETYRRSKREMRLGSLEIGQQKSLMSNFWNDKLTKRQLGNSTAQKHSKEDSKVSLQQETDTKEGKETQIKWKRQTVQSLRDQGLEIKPTPSGPLGTEGSHRQETSIFVKSRAKNIDKKIGPTNKKQKWGFRNKASGSIELRHKKIKYKGHKDNVKVKISQSFKAGLKGSLRKMKSISPPNKWNLARFNKMKKNLFKKKKMEELLQNQPRVEKVPLATGKKLFGDIESSHELRVSENFFCNTPSQNISRPPQLRKAKSGLKDNLSYSTKGKFGEFNLVRTLEENSIIETNKSKSNSNVNNFLKKTLPEITEGEVNESSENTVIVSGKKLTQGIPQNLDVQGRPTDKENKRPKKDVDSRKSWGGNLLYSKSPPVSKGSRKNSQLGKRLLKYSKSRHPKSSVFGKKSPNANPLDLQEKMLSSRNQNLKKNFEELSKQMKKNSERFYLGSHRQMERNDETKFKIMNTKNSNNRKSKIDGSKLTTGAVDPIESKNIFKEPKKSNLNNRILNKAKVPKKMLRNMRKENRSLGTNKKRKLIAGSKVEQSKHSKIITDMSTLATRDGSNDKRRFLLPKNLKMFKASKKGLRAIDKAFRKDGSFNKNQNRKKIQSSFKRLNSMNGSQEGLRTHEGVHKRMRPLNFGKGNAQKSGLILIKKKLEGKKSLLKARSFDKHKAESLFGGFTFGK